MEKEASSESSGIKEVNLEPRDAANASESSLEEGSDSKDEKTHSSQEYVSKNGNGGVLVRDPPFFGGIAYPPICSSSTTPSFNSMNAANDSISDVIPAPIEVLRPRISTEESEIQTALVENVESKSSMIRPAKEGSISITSRNSLSGNSLITSAINENVVVNTLTYGNGLNGKETPEDRHGKEEEEEEEKVNIELLQCKPDLPLSSVSCEVETLNLPKGDFDKIGDSEETRIGENDGYSAKANLVGLSTSKNEACLQELPSANEGNPSLVSSIPSFSLNHSNNIPVEVERANKTDSIQPAMKALPTQVRTIPRVGIRVKTLSLNSTLAGESHLSSASTQSVRLALPKFAAPSHSASSLPNTQNMAGENDAKKKEKGLVGSLPRSSELEMREARGDGEGAKVRFNLPPPPALLSSSRIVHFAPSPPNTPIAESHRNPKDPPRNIDDGPSRTPEEEIHRRLAEVKQKQEEYHAAHKAYYSPECVIDAISRSLPESPSANASAPLSGNKERPPLQYLLNQPGGLGWRAWARKLRRKGEERAEVAPVGFDAAFRRAILGVCGRARSLSEEGLSAPDRVEPRSPRGEAEKKTDEKRAADDAAGLSRKWGAGPRLSSVMRALAFRPRDPVEQGWFLADPPHPAGKAKERERGRGNDKKGASWGSEERPGVEEGALRHLLYPANGAFSPSSSSVVFPERGRMGGDRLPSFALAEEHEEEEGEGPGLLSFTLGAEKGGAGEPGMGTSRRLEELTWMSRNLDAMVHWGAIAPAENKKEYLDEVLKQLDA